MPADDKVRVEVAYEGGQAFTTLISTADADELERRLSNGDGGILTFEAEDGRYAVVLRNVAYVKRFLRESRVGFGTPGP
jgi:O-acetylhomoserine/O-acetylserine sulfhydrylase-like pyridoxal-dependent enzyme